MLKIFVAKIQKHRVFLIQNVYFLKINLLLFVLKKAAFSKNVNFLTSAVPSLPEILSTLLKHLPPGGKDA